MTSVAAARTGEARNGDIRLVYEVHGDVERGRPLLLICGLGQQLVGWHPDLLAALVDRGHAVAIFDNRDVGLSTHLDGVPVDFKAIRSGAPAPYLVADMAADAHAVLTAVGWSSAHVAGGSLGGMIAQAVAIAVPERVRSLISVMSTTGDRAVGRPAPGMMSILVDAPPPEREAYLEHQVRIGRQLGSPVYPAPEQELRAAAARAYDRAFDPRGVGRQFGAILGSPDRTAALQALRVPALVIHGRADRLVDVSGAEATAAALHARLLVLDGMAHDLPRPLWPQLLQAITDFTAEVDRDRDPRSPAGRAD
ncbi:MAG TPA: alpha/beta fold hydrolase [Mycobacteriales bacterium]|jgi:pimeloyl-ACP methyl ester carboxylesterase|nr:alpha/beta fold hydrolase [Mycobacteriales bacterium]